MQAAAGPALRCRPLAAVADHVFTTRAWRLGSSTSATREHGWAEVAASLRVERRGLARVHQVHGATVIVPRPGVDTAGCDADILVTDDADFAVAVQAADCVPLLVADRRTGVVAAAHAGWRGLAARVPQATVRALMQRFDSRLADLVAAIGPSIGACCYEVGADVRDAFVGGAFSAHELTRWFYSDPQPTATNPSLPTLSKLRRSDHWFFDAWAAARQQLESIGMMPEAVHVAALCTASHPDLLCSYRRDGKAAGRMAAAIRPTVI